MTFLETDLGFEYKTPEYLIFFGKRDASVENLKKNYPEYLFKSLHQVHGSDLLHTLASSDINRKADAHWTGEKNVALVSKSADCIPFLAFDPKNHRVLAIHAGWRGVQNRIIPKTLTSLGSSWEMFLGPHILKNSFEIQDDCRALLAQSTILNEKAWYQDRHADLFQIVTAQISEIPASKISFQSLLFDTKSDLRFHSFRRDRDQAGRQNSFVVLV